MEWQEVAVLVLFVLDVVLGIAIFFLEPIQDLLTYGRKLFNKDRKPSKK
jgi:hypothetical protein